MYSSTLRRAIPLRHFVPVRGAIVKVLDETLEIPETVVDLVVQPGPVPNVNVALVAANVGVALVAANVDVALVAPNVDVAIAAANVSLELAVANIGVPLAVANVEVSL